MLQPLYHWRKRLQYPLNNKLGGPKTWSGFLREKKNLRPIAGVKPRFLRHRVHSLFTIPTALSWFHIKMFFMHIPSTIKKNGIYLHGTQLSSTFSVHWMPCLKYLMNTKSSSYGNTIVQICFHVLLPLLYTYHNIIHGVRLQTIQCVTIQMWPCRTRRWFHRQHNLLILFWHLIWNYKGF